jgi:tRNA/rRNA methyltransferase
LPALWRDAGSLSAQGAFRRKFFRPVFAPESLRGGCAMNCPARLPKPDSLDKRLDRVRIVLSRPRHPGNIGAAARAMKTMGLSRLALVAPENFPHPEALARSAGAEDVLNGAEICTSLDEALNGAIFTLAVSARRRNLGPEALAANDAADETVSMAVSGDVALVFGNETSGLSNEDARRCQRVVYIPANPD